MSVLGATNDGIEIVLHCLDVMLTKRRKQVSHQRALAFIKRLCTLALQVLPNSSIGLLATIRILMHVSTGVQRSSRVPMACCTVLVRVSLSLIVVIVTKVIRSQVQ